MWQITIDFISHSDSKSAVGTGNPGNLKEDHVHYQLPYRFRLYDDDGVLYFEGASSDRDSERAFDPLDWAQQDSGCTEIRYLIGVDWKTL